MKYPVYILLLLTAACKGKKEKPEEPYFPAISFLKSQVAHVDTSLYNIIKVETAGGRSDTTHIRREEFRKYAEEFTALPEIASEELQSDYRETKGFDETMKRVVLVYETKEEDAPITMQQVTFVPDAEGSARPKTVYITRVLEEGNGTVHKSMLWQVDRQFSITTRTVAGKGPETVKKLEIIWNDNAPAY